MANLIIKPQNVSGDKVIIQDQAGGAVLTTADSGATIANVTLTSPAITGDATSTGHFTPSVDNSKDLGSASKRWRNFRRFFSS